MDYNKTFESRCGAFKYAMETYPHVMAEEFRSAIDMCQISNEDILLNIPAACIPLDKYFTVQPKKYIQYETNKTFGLITNIPYAEFYDIPELPTSVSKIISLASLHHASTEERLAFYKEARRILDPSGMLVIGDVIAGSPQDRWLNEFVDKYNPSGHKGIFWSEDDCALLKSAGFTTSITKTNYHWNFSSATELIDFVRNLFGVSNATDDVILDGVKTYLFAKFHPDDTIQIPWQLIYFHCLPN